MYWSREAGDKFDTACSSVQFIMIRKIGLAEVYSVRFSKY